MNKGAQKQRAVLCYLQLHSWSTWSLQGTWLYQLHFSHGFLLLQASVQSHCYHQFNPSLISTGNMRLQSLWYFEAVHHLLLLPASLAGMMPECLPQGLSPFQLYVQNHSKVLINFNSWLWSNLMRADGNWFSLLCLSIFFNVYICFSKRVVAYSEPGPDRAWLFN